MNDFVFIEMSLCERKKNDMCKLSIRRSDIPSDVWVLFFFLLFFFFVFDLLFGGEMLPI